MNESPKHRKNELNVSAHFRAHRVHTINSEWYFVTREGQNIGPFPTKKEAEESLVEFLESIKKD